MLSPYLARSMGAHNGRQLLLCQVKIPVCWVVACAAAAFKAHNSTPKSRRPLATSPSWTASSGTSMRTEDPDPQFLARDSWKRLILRAQQWTRSLSRICQNCRCQVWRMLIAATILTYKLTNGTHESVLLADLISMQRWLDDTAAGFGAAWIL
jgi:hypothetical protein